MNQVKNDTGVEEQDMTDTRKEKYSEANDRASEMTSLEQCLTKLEGKGYTEQFKVEKDKLVAVKKKSKYKAKDVKAANFFRFEGISDPDDTSVLYAIETTDGVKGTLTDAYGLYADDDTGEFMKEVEIQKKVTKGGLF